MNNDNHTESQDSEFIPMTDDQQLVYTQRIRRSFVDNAVKNNVLLNGDRADKALLLQTLNDMDRSALSNKKIKSDTANGALNGQAAMIVASMLERMSSSAMREKAVPAITKPQELPSDFPAPDLVPGEVDIAAPTMNYKSFMAEQNKRLSKN